jgi:hypothetical protein
VCEIVPKRHARNERRYVLKSIVSLIVIIVCVIVSPVFAQIVETHEFGTLNTQYYIYSDGKTFKFDAQNTMTVKSVEVKSWLATNIMATFHIELRIQDSLIAKWDQIISRDATYREYYHTKQVGYSLRKGDSIVYKIYGNNFWSPEGGLRGVNYVKLTGEGVVSVQSAGATPTEFLLSQNYPNPFNPSTTIMYELPKGSYVRLVVYDMLGKEVSTIVNGTRPAGTHTVQFDGSGLPSGMYLYRLVAGDFVTTKRMILSK